MYWERPGPANTEATVAAAWRRAKEAGIGHIVVATNTGTTARALLRAGASPQELNIVAVTHHVGYLEPGADQLPAEARRELTALGVKVLTTTHLFANVERAITNRWGGLYPGGIISHTLRCFGEGTKVCLEISVMALDAGLIPYGQPIVAIGGTGRGADTAWILKPAHAKDFFRSEMRELICKPGVFRPAQEGAPKQ